MVSSLPNSVLYTFVALSAIIAASLPASAQNNGDDVWTLIKIGPIPIVSHHSNKNKSKGFSGSSKNKSDWKPPSRFDIEIGEPFKPSKIHAEKHKSYWVEDPEWLQGSWHSDKQTTTVLDIPSRQIHEESSRETPSKTDVKYGTHKTDDGKYWHYIALPRAEKCELQDGATFLIVVDQKIERTSPTAWTTSTDLIQVSVDTNNIVRKVTHSKSTIKNTQINNDSFVADAKSNGFDDDGNAFSVTSYRVLSRSAGTPDSGDPQAKIELDKSFAAFDKKRAKHADEQP